MDNLESTDWVGNSSPADSGIIETPAETSTPAIPAEATPTQGAGVKGWKAGVNADLRNSPLLQKFEDTPEGLNKALESHASLEKLLGHEKVPIPKDVNDVEGWNRFSKAMGIPDKAEGYGLADIKVPDALKGQGIDKSKFAEIVHAHKLTPSQAKGLWKVYNDMGLEQYNNAIKEHQEGITKTVNTLKGEWGDAYETNVELGQMVLNKFANDKETNDWLTATLSSDPKGIKFLAQIGEHFAENKIGEFQAKRFSLAPEQAQEEIQKIVRDPNHPYNSPKATPKEHQAAIDYVNSLYATVNRSRG